MSKVILETKDWVREDLPLILPPVFIKAFKGDFEAWQIKALKAGKIVLVRGSWCMLSAKLKTTAVKDTHNA